MEPKKEMTEPKKEMTVPKKEMPVSFLNFKRKTGRFCDFFVLFRWWGKISFVDMFHMI